MSREKQIEEMVKVLKGVTPWEEARVGYYESKAQALYNAGYRKQSEGEWVTETKNWAYDIKNKYCSNCGKTPHYDKHMREYLLTNFCPSCGAKMKGGAE